MHVEHQEASAPRCRGAGDLRCVEMITWGGNPTSILHLRLMDRLSNGTPSHGYPRAPCTIPSIKMEERRKINGDMGRSRTDPKGNHVKECSWRVDPLSEVVVCELGYLLTWSCLSLSIHSSPLPLPRLHGVVISSSRSSSFGVSWLGTPNQIKKVL